MEALIQVAYWESQGSGSAGMSGAMGWGARTGEQDPAREGFACGTEEFALDPGGRTESGETGPGCVIIMFAF